MESYYLIILICLVVLAISDLVVGVSNDAVNFLNSAFGSKVASQRTVLIVASVGILFGAISSSGMMEIARKGIFNPEMFNFADIMVIFLAVMLTDIILLDLFNTFGMPTSTTVSIMFELLGAAFVVALIKLNSGGDDLSKIGDYLNTKNAVLIISGIFLSVFIAFSVGTIVQYLARLIFSFRLDQTLPKYSPIFGALAITMITYFLLIKGMKGSKLIPDDWQNWMSTHVEMLLLSIFGFWTVTCYILSRVFKINVLKIVVLAGTFSLAMAFAGNDLVNFIGVPIAGMESYKIFIDSGLSPEDLNMGILGEKMQTNTLILLLAGVIMILTLWLSKKARSVTETEINLAREGAGTERFKANWLARVIVRGGVKLGYMGSNMLSENTQNKINTQFEKSQDIAVQDQPAFDLVRASVNLMMASVIIALATSLKLPLSTTYVSFMVAMGTSLADRAWSRDSAVYRVAGVINVISGWLFTALIAFSSAGIIAVTLYYGGMVAVIGLMGLTIFLIIRSQAIHKKLEKKKDNAVMQLLERDTIEATEVFKESQAKISATMDQASIVFGDMMTAFSASDRKQLKTVLREIDSYKAQHDDLTSSFYYYLKKIDSDGHQEGQFYMHVLNHLQNINQSIYLIGNQIYGHVNNLHQPLPEQKMNELQMLFEQLSLQFKQISQSLGEHGSGDLNSIEVRKQELFDAINELEVRHIQSLKTDDAGPTNSMLFTSILLETKDLLNDVTALTDLYKNDSLDSAL